MMRLPDRLFDRLHVRARRGKLRRFLQLVEPSSQDSVLDVGVLGHETYEAANYFLRAYPYPENLTALSVEDCSELLGTHPSVRFVTYGGREFPFDSDSFDICHSNAVVEHVGDWERQRLFVSEMVRVARRGFFTTPNRWFPVELHTKIPLLHYLPWTVFVRSSIILGKREAIKGVRLLDRGQVRSLIEDAGVRNYRILDDRVVGMTVTYSVFWSK